MTQLNIQVGAAIRNAPMNQVAMAVTATGTQTITVGNARNIQYITNVQIESTAGVRRAPSGACLIVGGRNTRSNVITIVDSAIAVGEIVHATVVDYDV